MKKESKNQLLGSLLIPILSVIGVLAVVIVAVQGVVFYRNMDQKIVEDSLAENKLVSENVSSFLSEAYAVSQEMAQNPSILTMDTQVQNPILQNCVENNPYIELLYIQGADGMQTGRSSGELADRSNRWWFQQMLQEKQPFVSESYYSVNTGMPCASIFFPMYRGEEFTGVFATDIKLDSLLELVSKMSDEKKDKTVFIIDGKGTVVAHPNAQYIEELYNYKTYTKTVSVKGSDGSVQTDAEGNIQTQEEKLPASDSFQKMITKVMDGKSDSAMVKIDGTTYYASFTPIVMDGNSDSWSAVTLQSRTKLMAPLYVMICLVAGIALVALLLAFFIVRKLTKRITDPVIALTDAIEQASEGDFSVRVNETGSAEIMVLTCSFNSMAEKISRILHDLRWLQSRCLSWHQTQKRPRRT